MNGRRESVLREMGLGPIWRIRSAKGAASELPNPMVAVPMHTLPVPKPPQVRPHLEPAKPVPETPQAPQIQQIASRKSRPDTDSNPAHEHRLDRIASLDWEALEDDIRTCTACKLCENRHQAVPGVGDRSAAWMLVGEGPGAEEDRRGEPFVGPAGQLLDDMLAAIGLERSQGVYIANAVKCRPPLNRTPTADEIAACLPYLERQIELVKPRLLMALGKPAAQSLLGEEVKINASRGRLFRHANIPVVITYHPAYLLRNQTDKGRAWEDLCFARSTMAALAADNSG